ncbi:MAG: porin, partial [Flavobacteriaceae bacterium]|nr:porin [Flavobacteriaceae bacterium]
MRISSLKLGIGVLGLALGQGVAAQIANPGFADSTTGVQIDRVHLSGYLDTYVGIGPRLAGSMPYMVSSARIGEVNVNLAALDLRYQSDRVRARVMPGWGTFMDANYAAGDPRLVEANAGFRLKTRREVWVDAGILGSPFTNESAISKDHLMYTRSLAAEYVPYYLSGLKLSYLASAKWNWYAYLANGWQQVRDQVRGPALVLQSEFRPNSTTLVNGNLFVGREATSAGEVGLRTFADLYVVRQIGSRWRTTADAYLGRQHTSSGTFWWSQANLIAERSLASTWRASGRLEYLNDPHNVVVAYQRGFPGFRTAAASLGLAKHLDQGLLRLESRLFYSAN